jgi:hypothetical protein
MSCSQCLAPYAVPAIRIGSDVRTHVTAVAAVTAIAAGNGDLRSRHRARFLRAYGPALRYVRAARPGRIGAVPGPNPRGNQFARTTEATDE